MKGTEKQIKWAEDIIERIEKYIALFEEENKENAQIGAVKEMHKIVLENMRNSYAGGIIHDFQDVENYKNFVNAIAVCAISLKKDYRKSAQYE